MTRKRERDPFVARLSATIEERKLLVPGAKVLVAVSGGPDSVALLDALVALGHRVAAGHVNHRLRDDDSLRDERFVERLCTMLGVPCSVAQAPVGLGANLEERAREARYGALQAIAEELGAERIATGHTRDDQVETVLHHLLRGAGATGLSGIRPLREDGVVRPLLDLGRDDVLAYLRRRGLRFRTDRTNRDPRFTRNRIRALIPLLERRFQPGLRAGIARLADISRDDDAYLTGVARTVLRRVRTVAGLDARRLGALPVAIARRVLRIWLDEERGSLRGVDLGHVEAVRRLAGPGGRGRVALPGGRVERRGEYLAWSNAAPAAPTPFDLALPVPGRMQVGEWTVAASVVPRSRAPRPSADRALFDADVVGEELRVASVRPGQRVRPWGLGGSKKLQDVFVDAKVPRHERPAWPILHAGARVWWIPRLVRGDAAPVAPDTRRVLVLEASRRGPRRAR